MKFIFLATAATFLFGCTIETAKVDWSQVDFGVCMKDCEAQHTAAKEANK